MRWMHGDRGSTMARLLSRKVNVSTGRGVPMVTAELGMMMALRGHHIAVPVTPRSVDVGIRRMRSKEMRARMRSLDRYWGFHVDEAGILYA
jgi:hypothetical protein